MHQDGAMTDDDPADPVARSAVHAAPQAPSTRRVAVADGVELAVYDWTRAGAGGRGFVLVHGLASNARLWDGVGRHLAAAGHRVLAVDQRGHGRSDKPDAGYDMAAVADDLHALITATGWDRPVAVGQSWGGNVVVELAARYPGTTAGIACVDGGFIDLRSRFADWDDCARALAPPALVGTPVEQMQGWMRSGHAGWSDEAIAGAMANFEVRADATIAPWLTLDRHLAVLRGMWEQAPLRRLAEVREPVLWLPADSGDVGWTHDKRVGLEAAAAVHPNSRTHWFSPADHDVHAQHPGAVADVLHGAATDGFFS
jgi:pimeloyl-ACP methyl ester carboxylesterase